MLICGPNGSGKTTLLHLLADLYQPESGTIRLGPDGNASVGLVFQNPDVQILGATVTEDLGLGLNSKDTASNQRIDDLSRRFGLADLKDAPVHALSGGEKRKLCLASSLARNPVVLLLDEPFSGLDYPGSLELRKLLAENKQNGLTQAIACHDVEPLIDLADAVLILDKGTLVAFGPPMGVLDQLQKAGIRPPCSWIASGRIIPWS